MELSRYAACICEGTAQQVIVSKLPDAGRLIFTGDDLLDGAIIPTRRAAAFEQRYLRKGFQEKITVLRVLGSRQEKFSLNKAEGKAEKRKTKKFLLPSPAPAYPR